MIGTVLDAVDKRDDETSSSIPTERKKERERERESKHAKPMI